jgi:hypothetical protein
MIPPDHTPDLLMRETSTRAVRLSRSLGVMVAYPDRLSGCAVEFSSERGSGSSKSAWSLQTPPARLSHGYPL